MPAPGPIGRFLAAVKGALPKDVFHEGKRIADRFMKEANGDMRICYAALSAEQQEAGYQRTLSEEAVVERIREMRAEAEAALSALAPRR